MAPPPMFLAQSRAARALCTPTSRRSARRTGLGAFTTNIAARGFTGLAPAGYTPNFAPSFIPASSSRVAVQYRVVLPLILHATVLLKSDVTWYSRSCRAGVATGGAFNLLSICKLKNILQIWVRLGVGSMYTLNTVITDLASLINDALQSKYSTENTPISAVY
ncbi:hypothetical protein C8R43DRAFT_963580 [Mycena crocata]|nr:hypothetical protein C8R43DRAFT_963580 [Mycena crocata]